MKTNFMMRIGRSIGLVTLIMAFSQPATAQDYLQGLDGDNAELGSIDDAQLPDADGKIVLKNCKIEAIAEPVLYASEQGQLILVPKEGDEVEEGQVIAKTDDEVAQQQLRVAYYQYLAEKTKLDSEIELDYAKKNAQVSEAEYLDAQSANEKMKNVVSPNMVRQRQFKWEASLLSIEKTMNDRKITEAAARVKLAEYDLAKTMVDRHEISAMVTGVVQEKFKHVGEWVKPGDPIAKLTRMDRLKVVGHLKHHRYPPFQLKGQPITIEIPTRFDPRGKPTDFATVQSTVSHVGLQVDSSDDFEVWAEFDNTASRDYWPGAPGIKMKLQLPQ